MRKKRDVTSVKQRDTQLDMIRQLMVAASTRGAWLTLDEIAKRTEYGEASISAQLRHLRKKRHGQYFVEKRPRRQVRPKRIAGLAIGHRPVWEYCVIAPRWVKQLIAVAVKRAGKRSALVSRRDSCRNA